MDVLEDYLDGKLDAKTMHKVEKISLEDPFVAEALTGLSQSRKRAQSLSLLQKQLQERIVQKPFEEKRWRITSHRLSIAAAAAVLFITVSILFWMKVDNGKKQLAKVQNKVDVVLAPPVAANQLAKDSIGTNALIDKVDGNIAQKAEKSLSLNRDKELSKVEDKEIDLPSKTITEAPAVASVVMSKPAGELSFKASNSTKADTVAYTVIGSNTELKGERAATAPLKGKVEGISMNMERFFTGRVYSSEGVPLPGALVRISGRDISAKTDGNGEFRVKADSIGILPRLTVGYSGFNTQEVSAKPSQPMSIVLDNTVRNQLNEVLVAAPSATIQIKGKIIDSKTRKPISGALVKLANNKATVVATDANGEFSLLTGDGTSEYQKIIVLSIGYVFREVNASTKQSNELILQARPIDKDFKLAIGAKPAIPAWGWVKWNEYIAASNKLVKGEPIGNVIILSFDVQPDGTPTNIKVDYGLSKAENDEAIRLINAGPKWVTQGGPKRRMQVDIKF